MSQISSYPSFHHFGHRLLRNFFNDPIVVEEKFDGSQISFGLIDGELCARSKGVPIILDAPNEPFGNAVDAIRSIEHLLIPGWVYRGEYFKKPKHITLEYARIPKNHIIIFDIQTGIEQYMIPGEKAIEAQRIGLECVPHFIVENIDSIDVLEELTNRESFLGGCTMEGVVLKNYHQFGPDDKILIAKYVREEFKEKHKKEWKNSNPTSKDVIQRMIEMYRVPARWSKAIQHLQERGELTNSPKDIGALIKEIPDDILKEHVDEIKDELFEMAWPHIRRGVTSGFPEWYKEYLINQSVGTSPDEDLTVDD